MANGTVVGVDLAKSVFEIAVSHQAGRISRRERLTRSQFLTFFAQQPRATVVMEACGSAHYWGRRIKELGHDVVLLPPYLVRPYVRGNKTDRADAKGILEASRNADIHPVPIKTLTQQVITTLHRMRGGWMKERTARINALRGLMREFGFFIPVGAKQVIPHVRAVIGDADAEFPSALRAVMDEACEEIRQIEGRVKSVEDQLEAVAEQLPAVALLRTIPGIGLLTATAMVGLIGDPRRFRSGRHFASYIGITPREFSSGLVHRLGHISRRGDRYLRALLIHGARAVLSHARKAQPDRLRTWAHALSQHRPFNKVAVAVANKLARTAWAVWTRQVPYAGQDTKEVAAA